MTTPQRSLEQKIYFANCGSRLQISVFVDDRPEDVSIHETNRMIDQLHVALGLLGYVESESTDMSHLQRHERNDGQTVHWLREE